MSDPSTKTKSKTKSKTDKTDKTDKSDETDMKTTMTMPSAQASYANILISMFLVPIKLTLRGIPSTAARHTAFDMFGGAIVMDCGWVPYTLSTLLLLITHGHSDHSRDIANMVSPDSHITICVPVSIVKSILTKIQGTISMYKGRHYTLAEVIQFVTIIGYKNSSDKTTADTLYMEEIVGGSIVSTPVATILPMGVLTTFRLRGNESVMIEALPCTHTVPTIAFGIHVVRTPMTTVLSFDKGHTVTLMDNADRLAFLGLKLTTTDDSDESIDPFPFGSDDARFDDVRAFALRHDVKIDIALVPKAGRKGTCVSVKRVLTFPDGLDLHCKDADGKILLTHDDYAFLSKYKIGISITVSVPSVLFFGDTDAKVFSDPLIKTRLPHYPVVVIECTFLEKKSSYSPSKLKKHLAKKHMFLEDVVKVAKKYPEKMFVLHHFSACYANDINKIRSLIAATGCKNLHPFL